GDAATHSRAPEELSVARVESEEVAFAAAAEEQICCGRENACVGEIAHFEIPLLLAGLGIDRADRAEAFVFALVVQRSIAEVKKWSRGAPAAEVLAFFVFRLALHENRRVVVPSGNVEESGARAVGRVVPVGAALISGIDQRALRRRR